MADWDDKALMESLVAGNENTFKEVYDRYYEKLFSSCFGIVKNTQDAEDIVIVTFTKLFKRHALFQSMAQVHTWLFLSARNNCIDVLRKRRRQAGQRIGIREMNSQDIENEAFNDELDVLLLEKIMELVGELPAQSQQVIRLRYLEGLKYKEIGEKLLISPRTVENLLRFALDRLRSRLGHQKLVLILLVLGSFIS
jgi:RNA polymerase sigma-70 factor (family 1)